jgi:CRP-like cAMP-binding protein
MANRNSIIQNASPALQKELARVAQPIDLPQGKILFEQDGQIDLVVFPDRGMVSFVGLTTKGDALEIAMIGRDGAAGASGVLTDEKAYCRATMQIAGAGTAIPVRVVRDLALAHAELRKALVDSEQLVVRQAIQSAVCVATHDVASRFARWLLRCRDATQTDILGLTHEYIAQMLAVRRASVSAAAHDLQERGLIRYHRGVIHILDAKGIHDISCECYEKQDQVGGAGR